jgi:hypothetical protein
MRDAFQPRLHSRRLLLQGVSAVFGKGALVGTIAVCIFLGRQAAAWWETGDWPSYPLWQMLWDVGLSAPASQRVGIQEMINWALESPAIASLAGLCILAFVISAIAAYADEAES